MTDTSDINFKISLDKHESSGGFNFQPEYTFINSESELIAKLPQEVKKIEDLYPLNLTTESDFSTVVRLLRKIKDTLSESLDLYDEDTIKSEDLCHHVIGYMFELYCFRHLGEGFSIIINGLLNSILNMDGKRLSKQQTIEIKHLIINLQSTLILTTTQATIFLEKLEENDLDVLPSGFNEILEKLHE